MLSGAPPPFGAPEPGQLRRRGLFGTVCRDVAAAERLETSRFLGSGVIDFALTDFPGRH